MRSLLKKHTKRIVPRRPRLASSAASNANANGSDDNDGIRVDGEDEHNNLGLQLESDVPPIEELAIEYTAAEIRQREAEVVAASEVCVWKRSSFGRVNCRKFDFGFSVSARATTQRCMRVVWSLRAVFNGSACLVFVQHSTFLCALTLYIL